MGCGWFFRNPPFLITVTGGYIGATAVTGEDSDWHINDPKGLHEKNNIDLIDFVPIYE